jgi:hypothetical protein
MGTERPNKIVVAVRLNRSEVIHMDRLKEDAGYNSRGEFSKNIILRAFDCIDTHGYPELLKRLMVENEQQINIDNRCIWDSGSCTCAAHS